MKKGSKKHTVALSTTSSIDKFPKSEITMSYINPYDEAMKVLEVVAKNDNSQEYCNFNYDKFNDDFNKKLTTLSSSINKYSAEEDMSNFIESLDDRKNNTVTASIDIYKNFHENMKTYPAYVSVEGATLLNVAFATEQPVFLSKLPTADIEIINKQLDKLNNPNIIREHSIVKMDSTKDFELWFLTKKSSAPITKKECNKYGLSSVEVDTLYSELKSEYTAESGKDLDEPVKIRLFNAVIHPEPINTIGVPVSINGELLVEAEPIDVKVKDGTLELNGAKDRFKYLAGITNKEEFKSEKSSPHNVKLSNSNEPVIIKNKNAYEIRLSLVDTATEIVKLTKCGQVKTEEFVSEVLQAAKALYEFVENK